MRNRIKMGRSWGGVCIGNKGKKKGRGEEGEMPKKVKEDQKSQRRREEEREAEGEEGR